MKKKSGALPVLKKFAGFAGVPSAWKGGKKLLMA
jgi:hypothetical protein